MKKIGIYSLIFILVFTMIPMPSIGSVSAESEEEKTEDIVLYAEEEGDDISLYLSEENVEADESEFVIPDESEALLIHNDSAVEYDDQLYLFIQYEDENSVDNTGELVEGYVDAESVFLAEDAEEFLENRQEEVESDIENKDSDETEEENDDADASEENEASSDNEKKEQSEDNDSNVNDEQSENKESEELKADEFTPSLYAAQNTNRIEKKKTSKLARIKNSQVQIYESIGGKSKKAGSEHTDVTYYVKKQATKDGETYYLISEEPSATKGTQGWVRSGDLSYHTHKGVDKKSKRLYLNGKGSGRSKAWGANEDYIHSSLSKYTGEELKVNLTEKVGKNTWYRGKINGKGEKVWVHSSSVIESEKDKPKLKKTSKLARIKNTRVEIYKSIYGESFKAGSKHTDITYYVKEQAKTSKDVYYLISTEPSATKGTVGWVKSSDVSIHSHKGVDKKKKILFLNGKGNARSKAWGAKEDYVHSSLSQYSGSKIVVNLTEKVGKNTWYRGKINGKGQKVWVHSSFVNKPKEEKTSKLARIKDNNVKIHQKIGGDSFKAGSKHNGHTYYVKREAKFENNTYYLISEQPSATKGTIGWVKSSDLSSHNHNGVDKKSKKLQLTGKGNARSKAWGASKEYVHSSLSSYSGQMFKVDLTEKVGKNIWYRGKINGKGKKVWIHSSFVDAEKETIVIDAGHGGSDPGTSGNDLMEKDVTLDVSKRIKKMLESEGYTVVMTRSKDEYVSLEDRSDLANQVTADLFVSIHVNSGGGEGIETWWYDKGHKPTESKKLAKIIQQELIKETKANNRGVKNGNLHINRESKMPSSLVEIGFIDKKEDAKKLKKASYKNKISKGVVNGISKYLSL